MDRVDVPLRYAYRLLNHGPTTLVTTSAGGRANIMAAQWVMPLDYDPPKLAVVVDSSTHTRALLDASGELALSVPVVDQAQLVWRVGSQSGAEVDKLAELETFAARHVAAPLVAGCLSWLEGRVVRSGHHDAMIAAHDLYVVEVIAAQVDARAWRENHLEMAGALRTLHHLGGGQFHGIGERVSGR